MVSPKEGCAIMRKKYIVRLMDEERKALELIVRKFKGTSQKVRRAQVLLKADVEGAGRGPGGRMRRSRTPMAAAPGRWRTSGSGLSRKALR